MLLPTMKKELWNVILKFQNCYTVLKYFAGKSLSYLDLHLCLMVDICFPPEKLLNNVAVAFQACNEQWCLPILYM